MSSSDENNKAALEARIRKLERQARLSSLLSLMLLAAVIAGGYRMMNPPTTFVDRHGNFQLLNDRAEAQVYLYKGDSSSGLKLYDAMNEQRATFATSGEGSAMTLRDYQTTMRMMARVSAQGPELLMADADKNIRLALQVHEDGPRILFYDAKGEITYDTNKRLDGDRQVVSASQP